MVEVEVPYSDLLLWAGVGHSSFQWYLAAAGLLVSKCFLCCWLLFFYPLAIDCRLFWGLTDFIFLGSKITADGECSYEIKRSLLLGRKAMSNLGSIFKSRDITLPTKVHLLKAMVFLVVMYGM